VRQNDLGLPNVVSFRTSKEREAGEFVASAVSLRFKPSMNEFANADSAAVGRHVWRICDFRLQIRKARSKP
jgi:hypothetical protein